MPSGMRCCRIVGRILPLESPYSDYPFCQRGAGGFYLKMLARFWHHKCKSGRGLPQSKTLSRANVRQRLHGSAEFIPLEHTTVHRPIICLMVIRIFKRNEFRAPKAVQRRISLDVCNTHHAPAPRAKTISLFAGAEADWSAEFKHHDDCETAPKSRIACPRYGRAPGPTIRAEFRVWPFPWSPLRILRATVFRATKIQRLTFYKVVLPFGP